MKFRIAAVLLGLVALGATLDGQTLGKSKHTVKTPSASVDKVTLEETSQVMTRVRSVVYRVVLNKAAPKGASSKEKRAATRGEIVGDLYKLFNEFKPEFRVTPRMIEANTSRFTLKTTSEKTQLETLVKWGFIDRVSPIATSSSPNLSLEEFGDALGFYLSRMAELTHSPSSKFTPALMAPGG